MTLKASDAPAAPSAAVTPVPPTAPVAPPTAPVAPPVAIKPPTPTVGMPKPPAATVPAPTIGAASAPGAAPAPAPTIPLKTAPGAPRPMAAPTIKLNTGAPAAAPTIPLKTAGPMAGLAPATKPLAAPGPASAPLPTKSMTLPTATVQLAPPTQPMITGQVSATQMATLQSEEEEDAGSDTLTTVLSIFGFLAACGVLGYQCMTMSIWDGWNKIFAASIMF